MTHKNTSMVLIFFALSLLLLSCSTSNRFQDFLQARSPAQTRVAIDETTRLDEFVSTALMFVKSDRLNKENCALVLEQNYAFLTSIKATHFDRSDWTKPRLQKMQTDLWSLNLALRQKIRDWAPYQNKYASSPLDETCVASLRDSFRAIRFVSDYLGYLLTDKPTEKRSPSYRVAPYVLTNSEPEKHSDYLIAKPKLSYGFELHSGDILASRGNAVTSAAIARMGAVDSQFSHLALVYVDPKTKVPWTIEAHIESGVQIATFKHYLEENPARVVQFRFRDGELAHKSAEVMFKKARAAFRNTGRGIPYDFKADLENGDNMYCSEVVRTGYNRVLGAMMQTSMKDSRQLAVPPMFLTNVMMKNRSFLDKLQVPNGTFFAPGDMELDARFELISEWRDYARVTTLWAYDAALTSVYSWMEDKDYKVQHHALWNTLGKVQDLAPWVTTGLARAMSKPLPPKTLNGDILSSSRTLAVAGSIVINRLLAKIEKLPYKPSPREMRELLEEVRQEDAEAYRRSQTNKKLKGEKTFHQWLRPDDITSSMKIETVRLPSAQDLIGPSIHKKRVEKVHLGED